MAGEVNVLLHVGPGQSPSGVGGTSPTATTTPPGRGVSSGSQPVATGPTTSSTVPGGRPPVPTTTPLPATPAQVGHAPILRPPGGGLPFTGLDALLLTLVALCLIGGGTVSLLVSPFARPRARA